MNDRVILRLKLTRLDGLVRDIRELGDPRVQKRAIEMVSHVANGTELGTLLDQRLVTGGLSDYAALNPRSGPFWCRMGYRPLWNTWQRRPAIPAG